MDTSHAAIERRGVHQFLNFTKMNTVNFDFRKFRCAKNKCEAQLPEVFCKKVMIKRREIPHFSKLLDALGDAVLSYHILPPSSENDGEISEFDPTWIFIWVDPSKYYDPDDLVLGAGQIAAGMFTLEQKVEYLMHDRDNSLFLAQCRETNCPVCSKNHTANDRWAMTKKRYHDSLASVVGAMK
jgi:hypothetical protein